MKLVKHTFLESLERELMAAMSLAYIVDLGKGHFEIHTDELNGKFRHGFISINESGLGNFANANVAVEDAYKFVKSNPWLIIEIFHGLMIQSWFQFLSGIYREMIYSMRHGLGSYPVGKIKIQIDPDLMSKEYLPDAIRRSLSDDFELQSAKEQIRIVVKGLKRKLEDLEPELSIVRQEIIVRNLIQHNKGYIRIDDIQENGGPISKVDTSADRTEKQLAGSRVQRDLHDLRKLASVMARISEKLVPEASP
ncbi:MAG: hypothetical protein ACXVCE_07150 [Bacteriovorax sp.]